MYNKWCSTRFLDHNGKWSNIITVLLYQWHLQWCWPAVGLHYEVKYCNALLNLFPKISVVPRTHHQYKVHYKTWHNKLKS